jgi:hypothetical protein
MIGVDGAVADSAADGDEVSFYLFLGPAQDPVEGSKCEGLEAI